MRIGARSRRGSDGDFHADQIWHTENGRDQTRDQGPYRAPAAYESREWRAIWRRRWSLQVNHLGLLAWWDVAARGGSHFSAPPLHRFPNRPGDPTLKEAPIVTRCPGANMTDGHAYTLLAAAQPDGLAPLTSGAGRAPLSVPALRGLVELPRARPGRGPVHALAPRCMSHARISRITPCHAPNG